MTTSIRVAHVTTVDLTLHFLLLGQLQALQREGFEVMGVSRPGQWTAALEKAGIRHCAIPSLTRNFNPVADLAAFRQLVAVFRRVRPTIVHTHMAKTGVLGRLAARVAGVPIVVNTVHGPYGLTPGHPGRRFYLAMERLAARASDFDFSQSREILDQLFAWGVLDPARAAHLGNGINLRHFSPEAVDPAALAALRTSLAIPAGSLVVGTVGRLVHDKGYREFIAAAGQIRGRFPKVCFIAVGPAEESKADALSAEEIRRAEVQGVRFLGMRTDMRELYALMDIFVLASYREGFPRSPLEASAMGKPLILSDIPGCREVVKAGYNGLLVPKQQVEPLTRAIASLLSNEELRSRLGANGRRRALAEFDEQRVFASILDVYRRLLLVKRQVSIHVGQESPAR